MPRCRRSSAELGPRVRTPIKHRKPTPPAAEPAADDDSIHKGFAGKAGRAGAGQSRTRKAAHQATATPETTRREQSGWLPPETESRSSEKIMVRRPRPRHEPAVVKASATLDPSQSQALPSGHGRGAKRKSCGGGAFCRSGRAKGVARAHSRYHLLSLRFMRSATTIGRRTDEKEYGRFIAELGDSGVPRVDGLPAQCAQSVPRHRSAGHVLRFGRAPSSLCAALPISSWKRGAAFFLRSEVEPRHGVGFVRFNSVRIYLAHEF